MTASGEELALQHQHASFFLAMAEQAEPTFKARNQGRWLERLDAELDNLRSVLHWSMTAAGEALLGLRLAGALRIFWEIREYWSEGRAWQEWFLTHTPAEDAWLAARAKALTGAGRLALKQGDLDVARLLLEEALVRTRALADTARLPYALSNFGTVKYALGDYAAAVTLWEESLAIRRDLNDTDGIVASLGQLGSWALDRGDYVRAVALFEEGLQLARELGNTWLVAGVLRHLAQAARYQQDYDQAASLLDESLRLSLELDYQADTAWVLNELGVVTFHRGDTSQAALYLRESLRLHAQAGDKRGMATGLEGLAAVAAGRRTRNEQHDEAMLYAAQLWGAAEAIRSSIGAPLTPAARSDYNRNVAAGRACVDERVFRLAWSEGQRMTLEQATAYALEKGVDNISGN